MIVLISEAKTQKISNNGQSIPLFINEAKDLFSHLSKLNKQEIKKLFNLSDKMSISVSHYYSNYDDSNRVINSYQGLVFQNLMVSDWTSADLNFATNHLFILSAMYGILKPTDNITLHRLDFKVDIGINLYDYWSNKVTEYLIGHGKVVINLASKEYSKMVSLPMINIIFGEIINNKLISKSTYSKINRGKMVNIIVKEKITTIRELKSIVIDNYIFDQSLSNDNNFYFVKRSVDNNFI